jgi:hypothetical protein
VLPRGDKSNAVTLPYQEKNIIGCKDEWLVNKFKSITSARAIWSARLKEWNLLRLTIFLGVGLDSDWRKRMLLPATLAIAQ